MKFLSIISALFLISLGVCRFGKELNSNNPDYRELFTRAIELVAVAVIFANL